MKITWERLKELLKYDPKTGIFVWLKHMRGGAKVGDIAGSVYDYVTIHVDGKSYQASRLAFFYVHGIWPTGDIDHLNGVKTDNRIENLRDVSTRDNCSNRKSHREGHLVGTYFCKQRQKWVAQIKIKGKRKFLGRFKTQLEAHKAYNKELKELNEAA